MKKRYLAAGLVGSFFAGAVVYSKLKEKKDDNVLMYPVCRVTMHNDTYVYAIDELIKKSDFIITGYVVRVNEPKWNNNENKQPNNINDDDVIYKDYIIKIENLVKGMDYSINEVKLRSFEGTINGFTIEDNSQIVLNPNDKITVFLEKDKSRFNKKKQMDYFVPVGDKQGVFLYNDEKISNTNYNFDVTEFNSLMQSL